MYDQPLCLLPHRNNEKINHFVYYAKEKQFNWGVFFFAYFLLYKQKKVSYPRRNPIQIRNLDHQTEALTRKQK